MILFNKNRFRFQALLSVLVAMALSFAAGVGRVCAQNFPVDTLAVQRGAPLHELIRGQFAGVQVTSADGAPGAAASVAVRGIRSVRGDQQPLVVLDGAVMIPSLLTAMNPWNPTPMSAENPWPALAPGDYMAAQNLLSGIDLHDIVSVEVLSDASATAIWGSRGANGVILITTRSGANRVHELQLNSSVGVSWVARKLDFLKTGEYNDFAYGLSGSRPDEPVIAKNWQNELYSPALTQSHNITLSGNAKKTDYTVSLYYRRDNGIIDRTHAEDMGLSTAIKQSLGRRSAFGFNILFDRSTISMTQSAYKSGGFSTIGQLYAPPFEGVGNSLDVRDAYDDKNIFWRVTPRGHFKVGFADWLAFNVTAGADFVSMERSRWLGEPVFQDGMAGIANNTAFQYNADATLDFNKKFGGHRVTASVGGHAYGGNSSDQTVQGTDFFNPDLRAAGVNLAGNLTKTGYGKFSSSTAGLSARAGYDYKGKYAVSGGVRADQLGNFDPDMSYYPFAEAKWDLYKERFLGLQGSKISMLSLKAGWGRSGMDRMMPYFQNGYLSCVDNVARIPWEEQVFYRERLLSSMEEYNVALQAGFDKGRYTFEARFYSGNSKDRLMIYNKDRLMIYKSDSTAVSTRRIYFDKATMDKKGAEFSITATALQNHDSKWLWWGTISFDRSRVTSSSAVGQLGATGAPGFVGRTVWDGTGVTAFVDGYAPGVFYGYRTDGIVGPQHKAQTPPFGDRPLQVGDVKFVDVNGDGVVDPGDKTVIGNPNPKFIFAVGTSYSYKRWTFAARVDGSYGNDVLNLNRLTQNNVSLGTNVIASAYRNAWSPSQPGNKGPAVGGFGMGEISDRMVEDGSYIRLGSLSVAWDVPLKHVDWIRSLAISVTAGNLLVITPYKGYDPEVDSFSGDWALRGVDLGAYPRVRSFSLGINAKF